jgi:hypothetical protein
MAAFSADSRGFEEGFGVSEIAAVSLVYTRIVYATSMKKITFSADDKVIRQARLVAHSRNKTLNSAFREWLENTGHSLVAGLRSTR